MNLYEINAEMNALMQEAWDMAEANGGEIPDGVADAIDDLQLTRDQKIEGLCCVIKGLTAEADALKAEETHLKRRRASVEKNAEKATQWLKMNIAEGEKYSSARAVITWRKSEAVVGEDVSRLPDEFVRETIKREVDKTALKAVLKGGRVIDGWSVETRLNIGIK